MEHRTCCKNDSLWCSLDPDHKRAGHHRLAFFPTSVPLSTSSWNRPPLPLLSACLLGLWTAGAMQHLGSSAHVKGIPETATDSNPCSVALVKSYWL